MNILIINHYATRMYKEKKGRHFDIAQYLLKKGHKVSILCASTIHNSSDNLTKDNKLKTIYEDGLKWIIIPVKNYKGNGKDRMFNMITFAIKSYLSRGRYLERYDVVYSWSVHLFTLHLGHILSKRIKAKNVMEVRDLWPESLIAYDLIERNSFIAKSLFIYEKYLYKKAGKLIFTWSGAWIYLKNQRLDKYIPASKIYHISNGVDGKKFIERKKEYVFVNELLDSKNYKCFVYTGSIRQVNNVKMLVEAAEQITNEKFKLLIFGDGEQLEDIKNYINTNNITNVKTFGYVEAKYIPSIVSKAYVNVLHNSSSELDKYGQSQNKFFEYLCGNRCILQTYNAYNSKNILANAGLVIEKQDIRSIAKAFNFLLDNENFVEEHSNSDTYKNFDYEKLTDDLLNTFNE